MTSVRPSTWATVQPLWGRSANAAARTQRSPEIAVDSLVARPVIVTLRFVALLGIGLFFQVHFSEDKAILHSRLGSKVRPSPGAPGRSLANREGLLETVRRFEAWRHS